MSNSLLRKEWYNINSLDVVSANASDVILSDMDMHVWESTGLVMVMLKFSVEFALPSADVVEYFDIALPTAPCHCAVHVPFMMLRHKPDASVMYSQALLEIQNSTIRVRNFPFHAGSTYTTTCEFFYRRVE